MFRATFFSLLLGRYQTGLIDTYHHNNHHHNRITKRTNFAATFTIRRSTVGIFLIGDYYH